MSSEIEYEEIIKRNVTRKITHSVFCRPVHLLVRGILILGLLILNNLDPILNLILARNILAIYRFHT